MRLPLAEQLHLGSIGENVQAIQQASASAWQLRYHPEQHMVAATGDRQSEAERLLERKRELLEAILRAVRNGSGIGRSPRVNQRLAELNALAFDATQSEFKNWPLNLDN